MCPASSFAATTAWAGGSCERRASAKGGTMSRQSLEQKRAAKALEHVKQIAVKEDAGQYKSKIEQVPGMIAINGLIPALLHLRNQKQSMLKKILSGHLADWLTDHAGIPWRAVPAGADLIGRLTEQPADVY